MRGRTYINELGHKYGPYIVTAYTSNRENSNKTVIWKVECKCGHIRYYNGNNLRFGKYRHTCPICGRR